MFYLLVLSAAGIAPLAGEEEQLLVIPQEDQADSIDLIGRLIPRRQLALHEALMRRQTGKLGRLKNAISASF